MAPRLAPTSRGAVNTCVDVSLQPYQETTQAAYSSKVGNNVRITQYRALTKLRGMVFEGGF